MIRTTPGELLINAALPAGLRRYGRTLDVPAIKDLFQELADKHPDAYRDVAAKLVRIAGDVAYEKGGLSFGVRHLRPARAALRRRMEIRREMDAALDDASLDERGREKKILGILDSHRAPLEKEIFEESLAEDNPLARQVVSGVRGNKTNLRSLRGMDLAYVDHRDRTIPIPILRSYSEGLTPAEYWAGAYGARRGVVEVKDATAQVGYLGKQLTAAVHELLTTARDSDEPDEVASGRGMPTKVDDPDNVGALIAREVGGYPRNTVITPRILKDLQDKGVARMLVRSPIAGGPADGGLYARDVGVRERGKLPPVGDYIGHAASQALCLAAGTMVRMADGSTRAIEAVRVGDLILGCDRHGVIRPCRVRNAFVNGDRECWRTKFRRGTGRVQPENMLELVSTLDHKILAIVVSNQTNRDRRPAPTIRPVRRPERKWDRYYAKLPTGFADRGFESEPYALIFGLIAGNGCYTGSVSSDGIQFSCWDASLVTDVAPYMEGLGLRLVPQTSVGQYRVVDADHRRMKFTADGVTVRNRLRGFLLTHGLWGQSSKEKQIPAAASRWDNDSIAAMLGGLFATDGWVSETASGVSVGFSSSSRELIDAVRYLLATRFGIYGSGVNSSVKPREGGGDYAPNYKTTVNGWENVDRLMRRISPPGRKGRLLTDAMSRWPRGATVLESGRCAFVSQENAGSLPTYDIEVDHPDHLFVLANGLIVSNSEKLTQGSLCLRDDTPVRMADGAARPIRDVTPGEWILGADRHGRTFPARVLANYDNGDREVVEWRFLARPDGDEPARGYPREIPPVVATRDHKVLARPGCGDPEVAPLGAFERTPPGGLLARGVDPRCHWWASLVRVSPIGTAATRDLEVDHPDHLFVLANGLIVSNSSKHSGGVAGAGAAVTGFKAVERMVNPPKVFPGAAAHAQADGRVTAIQDAPQGGRFVWVGPEKHYVPPDFGVTAKVGDEVEAGDVLSEGIPNPSEIVKHKGVGEGRRYFVEALRDVYKQSGMPAHRRNVEILARGLIDHVTLDAELGDGVPGDVMPYSAVEASWTPRPDAGSSAPRSAIGRYLERPALHYTVGTKIRPSVVRDLDEFGVKDVLVHRDPPPFSPTMIRGVAQSQHNPDWAARSLGAGAGRATIEAARRGAVADAAGTSFVAPLALDPSSFGRTGKTVGWDPKEASFLDDLLDDDLLRGFDDV